MNASQLAVAHAPVVRAEVFSLDRLARANRAYRRVVYTNAHQQVVLMAVADCVPRETHLFASQSVHVARGVVRVRLDHVEADLEAGESIFIPPGAEHSIRRVPADDDRGAARIWVTYCPPLHGPLDYELTRAESAEDANKPCPPESDPGWQ